MLRKIIERAQELGADFSELEVRGYYQDKVFHTQRGCPDGINSAHKLLNIINSEICSDCLSMLSSANGYQLTSLIRWVESVIRSTEGASMVGHKSQQTWPEFKRVIRSVMVNLAYVPDDLPHNIVTFQAKMFNEANQRLKTWYPFLNTPHAKRKIEDPALRKMRTHAPDAERSALYPEDDWGLCYARATTPEWNALRVLYTPLAAGGRAVHAPMPLLIAFAPMNVSIVATGRKLPDDILETMNTIYDPDNPEADLAESLKIAQAI